MKVLTNIFVSNHQVFEIIIYVMFVLFLQTTDKNKRLKSWFVLLHLVSKQVSIFIIFFLETRLVFKISLLSMSVARKVFARFAR